MTPKINIPNDKGETVLLYDVEYISIEKLIPKLESIGFERIEHGRITCDRIELKGTIFYYQIFSKDKNFNCLLSDKQLIDLVGVDLNTESDLKEFVETSYMID